MAGIQSVNQKLDQMQRDSDYVSAECTRFSAVAMVFLVSASDLLSPAEFLTKARKPGILSTIAHILPTEIRKHLRTLKILEN